MDEKFEKAIENLVQMVRPNMKSEDAIRVTQAALNLAHAKSLLEGKKKQGAGA
jgi:hypothetical protein